jgi:hypothetical protein
MAVLFALDQLIAAVSAQVLVDWKDPGFVTVKFGQKEPRKNINIGSFGRIVFTDGDEGGDQGSIGDAAQWPHPAPALYDLSQRFQVFMFARDTKQPQDELAQWRAGMNLLTETARAIYRATHQDPPITSAVLMGNPKRINPEAQCTYGIEYRMVCTIEQPILDAFDGNLEFTDVAPVNANVTTKHESTTDTFEVRQQ